MRSAFETPPFIPMPPTLGMLNADCSTMKKVLAQIALEKGAKKWYDSKSNLRKGTPFKGI